MINGWKYFDLSVDTHTTQLTPVDEVLESSITSPNALVSANCLSRSAGTFIYRFDGPPTEVVRRAKERNAVIEMDLLQETDGHTDLYVHTEMESGYLLYDIKRTNPIIVEMPVEYTDDLMASIRILGPDGIIDSTYKDVDECIGICLEKVGYCRPTPNNPLEILTERQQEILRAALQKGYYEIPRRTSLEVLGDRFGIKPQTVGEHLRKIESKIIKRAGVDAESTSPASQTYGITDKVGD